MVRGDGADYATYVDARWPDLVGGLEDEGVSPEDARLAVADTLLAARSGWARRVREEQVDVSLWAEVRERAGLPPRPGEAAPHAVRPFDLDDAPQPWLARAEHVRSARRWRGVRRGAVGLAVLGLLAAGWAWWAARPETPEVRKEANPLPVVWYAGGDLHLEDVVVTLPGIDEFVAVGPDVAARMDSGDLVRIAADGSVGTLDQAPPALTSVTPAPAYEPPGRYDVELQSAPLPGGGWAYLIDSSRRDGSQDGVRQSETGRRALVACPTRSTCAEPVTIVGADGAIRLR
ncbi:hypothetical protein L2K70_17115 [Nocardioides KLBMP 9356]|uniref:Uncharacterized protein n=1 Tax=Nocardioides potassii TaxID=2911371 RepID=A0ABS9HDR4_9ACTN|nr:hypothetical protein [Nocardioides potassii]MCF6379335.1 hypothetical protein [Nocardioides potassii]